MSTTNFLVLQMTRERLIDKVWSSTLRRLKAPSIFSIEEWSKINLTLERGAERDRDDHDEDRVVVVANEAFVHKKGEQRVRRLTILNADAIVNPDNELMSHLEKGTMPSLTSKRSKSSLINFDDRLFIDIDNVVKGQKPSDVNGHHRFAIFSDNRSDFEELLVRCLMTTTVAIIVEHWDSENRPMPFQPFIDWELAVIRTTSEKLQVEKLLQELSREWKQRVMRMRRQGFLIWRNYFSSQQRLEQTTLSAANQLLGRLTPTFPVYSTSMGEYSPLPSSSSSIMDAKWTLWFSWNALFTPSFVLPSSFKESKDLESEQFTIVILTYKRPEGVTDLLRNLNDVEHLHSVIVVSNEVNADLAFTLGYVKLKVPVHVLDMQRNTLNNRFLPFDLIETDAVFHMDDDSRIDPQNIEFAFRFLFIDIHYKVWQRNRDRIVGFMGRQIYMEEEVESTVSEYVFSDFCEISIVLTNAAFIHKNFHHIYTQVSSPMLSSLVEELVNCEDIFMNTLVSDLTHKSPIMLGPNLEVTCKSSTCLGPHSLTRDNTLDHLNKRSLCGALSKRVFGYKALINTHFHAESIAQFYGDQCRRTS